MAGSDAVCIRNMTQGRADEHRELEAMWRGLRALLEQVAEGGSAALPATDVAQFVGSYERHLKREDDEVLPMATRLLTEDELARIGRAMRERRGIADTDMSVAGKLPVGAGQSSEERRGGNGFVRTVRYRGSANHYKQK